MSDAIELLLQSSDDDWNAHSQHALARLTAKTKRQRERIASLEAALEEAKRALEKASIKLGAIERAWDARQTYGQGTAAFLSVDCSFDSIRESVEGKRIIDAALATIEKALKP